MRHILHVLGLVLDLIGIGGMSDDVATWGEWAAKLHAQIDSPFITFPALISHRMVHLSIQPFS